MQRTYPLHYYTPELFFKSATRIGRPISVILYTGMGLGTLQGDGGSAGEGAGEALGSTGGALGRAAGTGGTGGLAGRWGGAGGGWGGWGAGGGGRSLL